MRGPFFRVSKMATVVFGQCETQFAPVPDEHGHTVRVAGINPDGARIATASVPLESLSEMREALWARSGALRHDLGSITMCISRRQLAPFFERISISANSSKLSTTNSD